MIKVNLLAANPGARTPKVWLPPEQRSAMLGLALLLFTASGVGGWWYRQHTQAQAMERKTASIQTELARLKVAAKLVDETLAKKAELTERLDLIERLRAAKRAPVSLLETVSTSVPDGLWLLEVKQTGVSVQMDGRAMSLTAVSDFSLRLQDSGLFKRPVEIVTTIEEIVEETKVFRFVLKAEAVPPPSATADNSTPNTGTTATPATPGRPSSGA